MGKGQSALHNLHACFTFKPCTCKQTVFTVMGKGHAKYTEHTFNLDFDLV